MKIRVETKGMQCTKCENVITKAIQRLDGIKHVESNHPKGETIVEFDEDIASIEKIKEAISNEGYNCGDVDYILDVNEKIGEKMKKVFIKTKGMQCTSCEKIIQKAALKVDGVKSAKADYAMEETVIEFDEKRTDLNKVIQSISDEGYDCKIIDVISEKDDRTNGESLIKNAHKSEKVAKQSKSADSDHYRIAIPRPNSKYLVVAGAILFLLGLFWIMSQSISFKLPEITPGIGLALIFAVGILTSFHCVGMCGGFVLSYTTKDAMDKGKDKRAKFISHLKYGTGKTITYTLLGALFGLLGSFIAFTPKLKGIAAILAGGFLILYGLNMINVFPWLRKLQFRGPKSLDKLNIKATKGHKGPFVIGLTNGLMIACGPLQAMLIYAAGTGSALQGSLSLLVFGVGTLPLMLVFGSFATMLGSKFTHKVLKVSALIVIILGVVMLNRGFTLLGTGYDINSLATSVIAKGEGITGTTEGLNTEIKDGYQEIRMDVTRNGWEPDKFVLKKGVPVKWIINGKEITGCNNAIQVPKLGLRFDIKPGEQVIEFTPTEEGVIPWSCWMGMLRGTFVVKEDIDLGNKEQVQKELKAVPKQTGGTCGMGGGCGCGGG